MARYRLYTKPSAERELARLPRPVTARLIRAIDALGDDPFTP